MLERKAENEIKSWIHKGNTALLVSGARQVGKTWSIRRCLEQEGCHYLELNLIQEPELIPVLEHCRSVEDLIINLSAAKNFSFRKGETILFIDEVQELKDIVTRVKFWVDEGSFRYVLSGSLLGIELRSLRSAPVGYLTEVNMFPLDFEEFLTASSVPAETLEHLRDCFHRRKPVKELVHQKMMQHFQRYLVVGGMPAAVQEYVSTGNINQVSIIQRNIIELYKLDFTKYEEQEKKLMLIAIYDQIPSRLLKQNRRFNYSDIKKGLRFERLEDSFLWLSTAGVAIPVYNATEPRVALNQNAKSSLLKLYSSDVGLLTCQYGNAIRMKVLLGDSSVNIGGVYENAVAQELNTHGFPMYFYNSHKVGELDFVIEKGLNVLPIEVKSGKDYYVHSAISKVADNAEYGVQTAYILANCNVSQEGKLCYLPVYLAAFIRDDVQLPILQPLQ
ncbi:MAG: ATP-binding protein [Oscillospiraceae bacterium]|nr:ATP-binding protein [Oscillospiraceae bacterium]